MTKQDYKLIARVINETLIENPDDEAALYRLVQNLSFELALENERFESFTFYQACFGD